MNLVSRYRWRDPNVLASTASSSRVKTKSESQNVPLSSLNVQQTSTGRPVYDMFVIDDDMDFDTATESNLSQRSRSFLKIVNDRMRKMLDRSPEDAMQDIDKRSMIWWTCLRHWKHLCSWERLLRQFAFHQKYRDNLTLKQMFEISEKLMLEQSDEIFGVSQISWENFSKETIISGQWWRSPQSLACKGICILRICVMSWKGESEPNIKYCLGTAVGLVQIFITIQNFGHNWRRTDGIRVEYFPGFTSLQLVQEVQKFMNKMCEPEQFQGRIIFVSMFNDIKRGIKDN